MIHTVTDLQNMQNNLGGNYQLANDIDASGYNFVPVGNCTSPFVGSLDGNGFAITNLTINSGPECGGVLFAGLFANVGTSGTNGTINNLRLTNVKIAIDVVDGSAAFVGSVAGGAAYYGNMSLVSVQGNVTVAGNAVQYFVGGIAGMSGTLAFSNADVAVTASSTSDKSGAVSGAGGLVGDAQGLIFASTSVGPVTGSGHQNGEAAVGGAVGDADNCVVQTSAAGPVNGGDGTLAGGLIGFASYSCTFQGSSATGPVQTGSSGYAGGLIGYVDPSGAGVSQAYATGEVTGGTGRYVGGLIGYVSSAGCLPISQTYAAGALHMGTEGVIGGLVAGGNPSCVANSYWDIDTTGTTQSQGGTGLTTAQMQDGSLDNEVGFDPTIWEPMLTKAVQPGSAGAYYPQLWAPSFPITKFPLACCTPYTQPGPGAHIITIVDHSLETAPNSGVGALYSRSCDQAVLAFNGIEGLYAYGQNTPPATKRATSKTTMAPLSR